MVDLYLMTKNQVANVCQVPEKDVDNWIRAGLLFPISLPMVMSGLNTRNWSGCSRHVTKSSLGQLPLSSYSSRKVGAKNVVASNKDRWRALWDWLLSPIELPAIDKGDQPANESTEDNKRPPPC